MLKISIDTETDKFKKPFLVSTCNEELKTSLYSPNANTDYSITKQLCESDKVIKIFHNAVYDIYALSLIGINVVKPYHCTMIMASLLNENYSPKNLKYLAKVFLKEKCEEAKELGKLKSKYKKLYGKDFGYDKFPLSVIKPYATKDALYTMKLYQLFRKPIQEFESLYNIEFALIPVLVDMIKRGLLIDRQFCKNELKNLDSLFKFYSGKLFSKVGKIFNINSHLELSKVLEEQKIFIRTMTEKGKVSTTKETLSGIKNKITNYILKLRTIGKQINTYYTSLLDDYTTEKDNTAHFIFYQSGAKTGRFSADLIQTIPNKQETTEYGVANKVRGAFIVREEFTNFYMDYDQIEMRLFASLFKIKKLIDAINNKIDPYLAAAADMFPKEEFEADKTECRRITKGICLGIIYGMGIRLLASILNMPFQKASEKLNTFQSLYGVRNVIRDTTAELYKKGYIELKWIGRRYRIPKHLAYKGVNAICQGSAAYVIKLAMIRAAKYIKQFNGLVNMLLTVHDELVFEIHNSLNVVKVAKEIKKIIEDYDTFSVPITASVSYSTTSWLNKEKIDL